MQQLSQTWDLDVFFPGGSASPQFAAFLDELEQEIRAFGTALKTAQAPVSADSGDAAALTGLVASMQSILLRLRQGESFTACLSAEQQSDKKAVQLSGRLKSLSAAYTASLARLDELIRDMPDTVWAAWLDQPEQQAVRFPLAERRKQAGERLPSELESLIADLAVDGYHGWGEMYNTAVSQVQILFSENGEEIRLSAGQAHNKLHSPDRAVRERVFSAWEDAWGQAADFCADALNHLAGFRLQVYKHRGWTDVHKEPLDINRMSGRTLDAMWSAIDRRKRMLVRYMDRKAKLIGVEKLGWHDVEAPVGNSAKHYSFDEAADMIVTQFRRFSPKLAEFAQMAFDERWIEAEDRPGKRPGGFCTAFPASGQTRIFMTYAGTASNVSTLAHELGHAYHQHVMTDMPALAQEYAMNVAETASTFAEMIVADAAVKLAASPEEKLALLEDKVQRSVAFFMNIHARFLFETRFYEARRQGLVGVSELNRLMEEAQQEAFCGALGSTHPHFWASKLHFYITEVPFYNFPYTFGYLFSSGIYARALKEGPQFEDRYVALLRDTASMTVEDLARKHLEVDLEQPQFWDEAVQLAMEDVEAFLQLTE
ncbi:M3 family oligoendopeptidase [Paenibacillus sp. y28]|uniref:M3 family oligoendopeptidase n=1 Tax=Paenibacillus sp. y28 TaxID=3129110 RepID=UPI003018B1BD